MFSGAVSWIPKFHNKESVTAAMTGVEFDPGLLGCLRAKDTTPLGPRLVCRFRGGGDIFLPRDKNGANVSTGTLRCRNTSISRISPPGYDPRKLRAVTVHR